MDFKDRVQKTLDKGLSVSKDLLGKAKDKAKDLSDIGVLKFEISQLKKQEDQVYEQVGRDIFKMLFVEGHATVSKKTAALKKNFEDIEDLQKRIEAKEELLKKYEKNDPNT